MASKSLELVLELIVKGAGGDIAVITKAIEELQKEASKLKSIGQLKDMGLGQVVDKAKELRAIFAQFKKEAGLAEVGREARYLASSLAQMQNFKLDIDLSKIKADMTAVAFQARAAFQQLSALDKKKLDLDVSQAEKKLGIIKRNMVDLLTDTKPLKIDIKTDQAEKGLQRVAKNARDVAAAKQSMNRQAQASNEHFRLLNTTLGNIAGQLLFVRRVVIAAFGADLAGRILETVSSFDKLNQSLKAVFQNNAAKELQFIRDTADRLGLSITDLANNWAKFAASVDPAKVSMEAMRENFLAVAEAGARLGLSTEEINGALTALSQIASKGRLSMEELRQQLGDRLPGAVRIAAEALGLTQAKLFALIEQGKISSDVFLNAFPKALRASFGTDTTTRIETVGAAVQRLKNSFVEFLNAVVRAGALDVFTRIINDLSAKFKDPAFLESMQGIANAIGKIASAAVGAAKPLAAILAIFIGFKVISGVRSLIASFTSSLLGFAAATTTANKALGSFVPAVNATSQAASAGKDGYSAWATVIGSFASVVTKAATTVGVLTLAYIAGKAAAEAWVDKLIEGEQRVNKINDALRESESAGRLSGFFAAQAVALEEYGRVSVLAVDQINALNAAQAKQYLEGVEGATALAEAQRKQAEQGIKQAQEEIKVIQLRGDYSEAARKKIDDLLFTISRLRDTQKEAAERGQDLAGALAALEARGIGASDAVNASAEALVALVVNADSAAESLSKVTKLDMKTLLQETKGLVSAFVLAREAGENTAKAMEKAFPKDLLEGSTKAIATTGLALDALVQKGLVPASIATDQLGKSLSKLDADDLTRFGINAQNAFDQGKLSAQGLALVLEGQLKSAFTKMGVDAEFAGTKISRSFAELGTTFQIIAESARTTGAQLKESLDVAINAAKTKEELAALAAQIDDLGLRTGKFSQELQDSFLRLDDKIRLTAATLDSALGDSFNRLGIKTKAMLTALADQAAIDFNRIKASGLATALELEAAFRKMAEEITKATSDGIPPISLRFEAIKNNAFDVLVATAEKAGERVRKAIENAIPLADTLEKLEVLADGIQTAFERGSLSAADFGEQMTKVGFAIREMAAKPMGELAAAVELFGIKTKDQLVATSDNFREAFQIAASSGAFTTTELAKAAQQYLDAYKEANNGVVDSFDPVVQKALEVVGSVNQVADSLDRVKQMSEPVDTGSLRDKSAGELQTQLNELTKAYRAIGIQNVQDLHIIQEIQKEMNRQGKEDAEARRKAMEEGAALMEGAADRIAETTQQVTKPTTPPPGGSLVGPRGFGGGQGPGSRSGDVTINLNGSGALTVDEVKRKVVPVLRNQQLRRG